MKSSLLPTILLWTAALPVAAQHQYENYTFTVPAGKFKPFEGYLAQYGAIDLQFLTFSSSHDSPTNNTSTFEVAVFRLPDACVNDDDTDDTNATACDLLPTEVGIGGKLSDDSIAMCCTQEVVDDGKCTTSQLGLLIVSDPPFDSDLVAVDVPAQNAWVHPFNEYYGGYGEYEAGKYVTLFANCNEKDGREVSVRGKADFGSKVKPYDFFAELHQCGVPIQLNPYYDVDDDADFKLLDFLFNPVANKCDKREKGEFEEAIEDFEQCTGLHWKTFIESFPSAVMGNAIHCGYWMKEIGKWVQNKFKEIDSGDSYDEAFALDYSEIYNLTGREECVDALEGHSIFGETLHKVVFEPDVMCSCAKSLQQHVPQCTMDTWPIPLVGNWMNISACLIQSSCRQLEQACKVELEFLDLHLPTDLTGEMDCSDIDVSAPSFALNLPEEYSGAPLPDTCERIAKKEYATKKIIERYEAYRSQCTEMWDGWAGTDAADSNNGLGAGANFAIVVVSIGAAVAIFAWGRSKLRKQKTNNRTEKNREETLEGQTEQEDSEGTTVVELVGVAA